MTDLARIVLHTSRRRSCRQSAAETICDCGDHTKPSPFPFPKVPHPSPRGKEVSRLFEAEHEREYVEDTVAAEEVPTSSPFVHHELL